MLGLRDQPHAAAFWSTITTLAKKGGGGGGELKGSGGGGGRGGANGPNLRGRLRRGMLMTGMRPFESLTSVEVALVLASPLIALAVNADAPEPKHAGDDDGDGSDDDDEGAASKKHKHHKNEGEWFAAFAASANADETYAPRHLTDAAKRMAIDEVDGLALAGELEACAAALASSTTAAASVSAAGGGASGDGESALLRKYVADPLERGLLHAALERLRVDGVPHAALCYSVAHGHTTPLARLGKADLLDLLASPLVRMPAEQIAALGQLEVDGDLLRHDVSSKEVRAECARRT